MQACIVRAGSGAGGVEAPAAPPTPLRAASHGSGLTSRAGHCSPGGSSGGQESPVASSASGADHVVGADDVSRLVVCSQGSCSRGEPCEGEHLGVSAGTVNAGLCAGRRAQSVTRDGTRRAHQREPKASCTHCKSIGAPIRGAPPAPSVVQVKLQALGAKSGKSATREPRSRCRRWRVQCEAFGDFPSAFPPRRRFGAGAPCRAQPRLAAAENTRAASP